MSTAAPSGEISEGKGLSYESIVKQLGALESRLDSVMSIVKEVNVKLEQQDIARRKAALLAQKIALQKREAFVTKREDMGMKKEADSLKPSDSMRTEEEAKKSEEEEAKRKKLEELKSRLQEVKSKVEEAKKVKEASLKATGKGNLGAVAEEKTVQDLFGAPTEMPPEYKEILGASRKFQELGLLSG